MAINFGKGAERAAESAAQWAGRKGNRAARELQGTLLEVTERVTAGGEGIWQGLTANATGKADHLALQSTGLKKGIPVKKIQNLLEAGFDLHTSAKTLGQLAAHPDAAIRQAVASNPQAPPEALATLAGDADPLIRRLVAGNPRTPPDVLARLATDLDSEVRLAVVTNPQTPLPEVLFLSAESKVKVASDPATRPEWLTLLATHHDPQVRLAVAANPATPPQLLTVLAGDADPAVRRQVAKHAKLPLATRLKLAEDSNWRVRWVATSTRHIRRELLNEARQAIDPDVGVRYSMTKYCYEPEVLALLAADVSVGVRREVASRGMTPQEVLARLATDAATEVRHAVASNLNTPAETLLVLSRDAEPSISTQAKNRLPVK